MAFKLFALAALMAVASAQYHGGYHHAAPVYHHSAPVHKVVVAEHDHHAPAHYQFAYSVHDPHTHDVKEQHETRNGDKVEGYYSLLEADGTTRIVHYTADKHSGFNAVVERKGHASHPQHVAHKVVAPVAHKVIAAPIHHAPLISHSSQQGSLLSHGSHHAPLLSHSSHHAPAVSYSQHSALSHHAAPVAIKAIAAPVHTYSAPIAHQSIPLQSGYGHGHGHGHATSHISFSSAPIHNSHHY